MKISEFKSSSIEHYFSSLTSRSRFKRFNHLWAGALMLMFAGTVYADHDGAHEMQNLKGGLGALEQRVWDCENGVGGACQGTVGDQGPVGNKGPDGDKGMVGEKGLDGDQGLVGDKGPDGDKGMVGDKGLVGDKGMVGDKGAAGLAGNKGLDGDQGPVGDEGPAGADGSIIQYVAAKPIAINDIQQLTVEASEGDFDLFLGAQTSPDVPFDIDPGLLQNRLQTMVDTEFILPTVTPDPPDVKVTEELNGVYHITFIGELAGLALELLTVDDENLNGGTATVDTGDEIGLTSGQSNGQLLTWNGSNWIAALPSPHNLPPINNMQPFQAVNYIIALTGVFPSRDATNPLIAEIIMFGGNFAPRGWAFCDGQLLPIAQNTALFSILGTTYGGDGRTTFGLPDLRGRVAVHEGTGPGLTGRSLGQKGGAEMTDHPAPP